MKGIAWLVPAFVLVAGAGWAEETAVDTAALLHRLEAAEARIKLLEETLRLAPAAPNAVVASSAPVVASAPAGKPAPSAVEPPPERPITHQLVSLTFNGLVQAWYAGGTQGFRDTFRIRRTEVYFNGQITEKARWQVMIDPSKALALDASSGTVSQSTRMLQNAVITFDYNPSVRWSVGQFKVPLSLEGQMSSGRLETVERALFLSDRARGGAYGDVRDIGLMARAGLGKRAEVHAGVFNGVAETQNETDRNDQKALAGNLVFRPLTGLQVGTSGAWGNAGPARPRRDRLGADAQWSRGPFTARTELMTGHDGPLARRGAYGLVGYHFLPRVEGVVRLDSWDPDTSTEATPESVTERDYVAGVNVFLTSHNLKLQANYIRKTFDAGVIPDRGVFLVNTQAFW